MISSLLQWWNALPQTAAVHIVVFITVTTLFVVILYGIDKATHG